MRPEEKQEMLQALESGRQALLRVLEGVSEETASRPPAPERWSILQCVEHVATVEAYLFGQIAAAQEAAPLVNEKREAAIRERAPDRTRAVSAPEGARPAGRFATVAEALEQFLHSRARTTQFVEDCQSDLRCRITTHPLLGTVNCYETLLLMAAHPARHAAQIAEIRAALSSTDRPS